LPSYPHVWYLEIQNPLANITHLFNTARKNTATPAVRMKRRARGGRVLWARALLCAACCGLVLLVARLCVRLLTDVAVGHAAAGAAQIGTTKGEARD